MLKFLDCNHDWEEWDGLVTNPDPQFSSAYYRGFGGGQLVVYNDGQALHPFRFQGNGWIGNAHNFGGTIGPPEHYREFSAEFDAWKQAQSLSERCVVSPFMPMPWHRNLSASEVVYVDLIDPTPFRPTTRHCIEKAKEANATTARASLSEEACFLFEMLYERAMKIKNAAPHWHYPHRRFFNILRELGQDRSALFFSHVRGTLESAAFLIFDATNCYYHWAANRGDHPNLGVGHFQLDKIIEWAKQQGFKTLMLGGGVDKADGLFTFKTGFSRKTLPCYRYTTINQLAGVA